MKIVVKVTANTLFDKPEARSSRIKVPIKKSTVIFKKLLMVKGGGEPRAALEGKMAT